MVLTGKTAQNEIRKIQRLTDWSYHRIAQEAKIQKDIVYRLMGGALTTPHKATLKKIRKLHDTVVEELA